MATSDHDGQVAAAAVATAAAVTGALMAAVTTPLPVGPPPRPPEGGPTKPIAEIELTLFLDDAGGVRVQQSGPHKDTSASVGAPRAARSNAAFRRRRGATVQPAAAVSTSNGGQARASGAAKPRAPVAPAVAAAATLRHSTNPDAACQHMPLSSCTTANLYCDPPVLPMPTPAAGQSSAAQPPGPGGGSASGTSAGTGDTGTGETAEGAGANVQGDDVVMQILLPSETLAAALGLQAHAGPGERGGSSSSSSSSSSGQGALGGAPDATGGRLVIVADIDYQGVSLGTGSDSGSGGGSGSGGSGSGGVSSAGGGNARSAKGNTQLTLSPFAVDLPAGRVSVRLPAAAVLGPGAGAAGLIDRPAAAGLPQTSSPASPVGGERAGACADARPAGLRGDGGSPCRDASSCCDFAAGTYNPSPTAAACSPGAAPASAARWCRRVWLHLMGVRRTAKEQGTRKGGEAASGAKGRAPGGASTAGASSTTAAGALSGVALEWLGFTEVLLVPAAAAYELQDAWQDMVAWVRTHGEAGDAGSSPTQQAAAAAAAASRNSSLGATDEDAAEPAGADDSLGDLSGSGAALPRFSRAAAHTHGHHMAALVRDVGTLLLGPRSLADLLGPVAAAAGAGAERGGGHQGSNGPLASAAEAARAAIEKEVMAWLRTWQLEACLRLVTGLDGDAEEEQETGAAAAAAVEGAQGGQGGEEEEAAWNGGGSAREDRAVDQGGAEDEVHTGPCSSPRCTDEASGSCYSPTCNSCHSCFGCPPSSGSSCSDTIYVLEQMLMLPYLATPPPAAGTAPAAASPQAGTAEGSCPGGARAGSFSCTPLELTRQLLSLAPSAWPLSPTHEAHPTSPGSTAAVSPAACGPSRHTCAGSSGAAGDPTRHVGGCVFAAAAARPGRASATQREAGELILSATHYGFADHALEAAYQRWRVGVAVGAGTGSSGNCSACGVPLPIAASCLVGALGLAACTWRLQGLGVTDRPMLKALAGMLWYLAPAMVQVVRLKLIRRAREARRGAGGKSAGGRCGAAVRQAAEDVGVGAAGAGCSSSSSSCEVVDGAAPEAAEDGVDNGHWPSSLVLYDTLVAACTGLLASLLGLLTYTCSRPCLDLKQDGLGCVLFVVLLRGVFAPLTQQLLPQQQLLVCVGMWAVDLVHVWVLWGGAAPTWVLVLGAVLVAYVNMVVCAFLDVRSRREFVRVQAGRQL